MSDFIWTNDLSVGEKGIDEEHQGLFALVNELESADMSHDYINSILDRLKRYTIEHFTREEAFMKKMGYPELDAHVEQHDAFKEWLETIRATYARFPQSPFIIGDSVNGYLQRWLRDHIRNEDMKYRDFVVAQKQFDS